ncbi:helix-turn-helix domain-containing protein [Gillisia hiemivivida]|uniref:Helix-turn-helix domain-containing protein n=1 Tax=Gillisia hiemivivida TaxID=291190 RepID=A0A5C6ZVI2_9FLAO|nr:helix-turn-helix domain-containing protein [Gillisia hiemivivida]
MIPRKTQVVIENISSEELSNSIKKTISELIMNLKGNSVEVGNDLMSKNDTAKFLNVSVRTLHNWTKNGILNCYSIGSRVYFKKTEIDKALTKITT